MHPASPTRHRYLLWLALPVALICLVALRLPAHAAADTPRDCFWAVAEDRELTKNFNWTDSGGRYYAAAIDLPPGAELVLRGQFPHSRYMSFTSYDERANAVAALSDFRIEPNPGSVNPFRKGAARNSSERDFETRIVAGPPPDQPTEPNTLHLAGPEGIGLLLFRIYLPDRGTDEAGGVALPHATLRLANGSELDEPTTCEVLNTSLPDDANELYEQFDAPAPPPTPPAQNPIVWERFFGVPYLLAGQAETTPLEVVRPSVPADENSGGTLSALDIAYASARPNRGFGPILVLHGRAPRAPKTLDGQPQMDPAAQVRYWSICENELRRRSIACIYDEDTILDRSGWFTAVMSTPADRPANATAECGVTWLNWGPDSDSLLILRHLLPEDSFTESLANVHDPGAEKDVVGDYLPSGVHMSSEDFEARGCGAEGGSKAGPSPGSGSGSGCAALIRGTRRADFRRGGGTAERILGRRGGDRIKAGAGDDCVKGNGGADRIYGQSGDDNLSGGLGSDRLHGGRGADTIRGGRGRDLLHGGPGRDTIYCSRGDRVVDPRREDRLIGGCR